MTTPDLSGALGGIDVLLTQVDEFDHDLPGPYVPWDVVSEQVDALRALAEARTHILNLIEARDGAFERHKIPVRLCQCIDTDNSACPIHTVSHPHTEGCCDQPEDAHRHMTDAEFEAACPLVFDQRVRVDADEATYRVDARRYSRGVGVTITRLFPDQEDDPDASGLCFDLSLEAMRSVLPLLNQLVGGTS